MSRTPPAGTLPPLLRPQVFGNHGGAEWLREPADAATRRIVLLLVAVLAGSGLFAAALLQVEHPQRSRETLRLAAGDPACTAEAATCSLLLDEHLLSAAGRVDAVLLDRAGAPQRLRLDREPGGSQRLHLPRHAAELARAGGLPVWVERRQPLYRLILPADHRAAGGARQ